MGSFPKVGDSPLDRFRDQLLATVRGWIGPRPSAGVEASDIVQEALLKAHRASEQFRGETEQELGAWLHTILRNTFLNAIRTRDRQKVEWSTGPTVGADDSLQLVERLAADSQCAPEAVAVSNEELLTLARALERLPDDQRTVVELKHLYGLSIGEICDRTGKSKASVVGLLFRGIKALRVLMGEPGSGAENLPTDAP